MITAPAIIGTRTEGKGWRRYYLVSSTYHVILRLESGILPDSWIYASATGAPIARDWGDATPAEIVAWYVRNHGQYGCVEAPGPEIDWAIDLLRRKAPEVAQLLTARNLACNSPDCWCRPYTTQGGSS